MSVAKNIIEQLGGPRFVAMTGATFMATERGVHVNLGRRRKVTISLEATDTYTVALWKFGRGTSMMRVEREMSGVYCDQLQGVFTELTGLRTSL